MRLEHRGTIFLDDDAEILSNTAFPAQQHVLRIRAPRCAVNAAPGSFAHVTCDAALPMRRPLSIMRASVDEAWIDILFKVTGVGSSFLAQRAQGDRVSVLGPIGKGFTLHPQRPLHILIGGGVGIPPMVFLAERLAAQRREAVQAIAFFGSEIPFPFRSRPSTLLVPEVPAGVIASAPLLEEWRIPSRLASFAPFAGCYEGFVTDLAAEYLQGLDADRLAQTELFACGPTAMLRAVSRLAQRFDLPAQVSLEEFMACAVGGCAGCAVQVTTSEGVAMKRVCVDGPVFEARSVFPQPRTP